LFARQGLKADVARAAELLSQTAGTLGTAEAVAGLGHALGELALADGDAAGAVQQFTYALDRLGDLTVPYERAESELRAAVALAATGERELAIGHLTTAYRAARRLGARPLATAAAEKLAHLGEKVERRLGRRAAGSSSMPACRGVRSRSCVWSRSGAPTVRSPKGCSSAPHHRHARPQHPDQARLSVPH
jgi:hypothetical protein